MSETKGYVLVADTTYPVEDPTETRNIAVYFHRDQAERCRDHLTAALAAGDLTTVRRFDPDFDQIGDTEWRVDELPARIFD